MHSAKYFLRFLVSFVSFSYRKRNSARAHYSSARKRPRTKARTRARHKSQGDSSTSTARAESSFCEHTKEPV